MNRQEILNRVITFEDGKLLCNGEEISIEEAQRIIQLQSKAMEEEVYDYIQNNTELETEDLTNLSDTVITTQMKIAQSKIDVKDLDDYQDIRKDIKRAEEICDKALSIFNFKNRKVKNEKIKNDIKIKWKYQPKDAEVYEPDIEEMIETGYELYIKGLILYEFSKQFSTTDIEVNEENIEIYGDLVNEFQVYIITKDIEIYFQIDRNFKQFEGLRGEFIASGLRVNSMLMQTSLDSYTKTSHSLKTAYTFNNIITREIRFLKNTIKQEINYSLSKSIAKSYERFATANFFMLNFSPLLDKKTKKKLNEIINESVNNIEENKKTHPKDIIKSEQEDIINIIETKNNILDAKEIQQIILNQVSSVFGINTEQIKIESRESKNNKTFEIQSLGQKILINIHDSEQLDVSSTNTLGTGKSDIQNYEVKGDNLQDKISKAVLASYLPILNRQIENIFNNIKGKTAKKISKEIEKTLKDSLLNMLENKLNNKLFKEKIDFVIDNIINIDSINYESVLEIIDKLINNFFINQFKDISIEIQNEVQNIDKIFNINKATLNKYNQSLETGDSLIERFDTVKKYFNRLLSLVDIIKLIQEYKNIKYSFEDYLEDYIERSLSKEYEIKKVAEHLSEDNLLGGIARKLLSLMDISLSSKDEMYRFNLDEILKELLSTNL